MNDLDDKERGKCLAELAEATRLLNDRQNDRDDIRQKYLDAELMRANARRRYCAAVRAVKKATTPTLGDRILWFLTS